MAGELADVSANGLAHQVDVSQHADRPDAAVASEELDLFQDLRGISGRGCRVVCVTATTTGRTPAPSVPRNKT